MPAPDTTPYIPRRYPREGTLICLLPAEPGKERFCCLAISERRHLLHPDRPSEFTIGDARPGMIVRYTEAASEEEAERLEGIVRTFGYYNPVRKRHFTQALRRRLDYARRNRDEVSCETTADQMAEEGLTR